MKKELSIIQTICEKHGVSILELLGSGRRKKIIDARVDLVLELKSLGLSLTETGILLGRRDHATIRKLLKKGQKKLSTD